MKSRDFYAIGLQALEGLSLDDFSHEDLLAMVAGRLLKCSPGDGVTEDEIRADCERAARICCELAFHPQGVELSPTSLF